MSYHPTFWDYPGKPHWMRPPDWMALGQDALAGKIVGCRCLADGTCEFVQAAAGVPALGQSEKGSGLKTVLLIGAVVGVGYFLYRQMEEGSRLHAWEKGGKAKFEAESEREYAAWRKSKGLD